MWGEMMKLMVGPIEAGNEHAGDIGNGEGEGEEDPHVTCNEQRSWHEVKKAPGDEDDVLEGTISFDSAFLGGATTSKTNWRWRRSSEAASRRSRICSPSASLNILMLPRLFIVFLAAISHAGRAS